MQTLVNGNPQNITVETGLSDDENIEITKGLNAGAQVILPEGKQGTATTNKQNQGPPPPI